MNIVAGDQVVLSIAVDAHGRVRDFAVLDDIVLAGRGDKNSAHLM